MVYIKYIYDFALNFALKGRSLLWSEELDTLPSDTIPLPPHTGWPSRVS